MPKLRTFAAGFHLAVTILLTVAVLPALKVAGLPLRFDWGNYVSNWSGLTIQASIAALFLCLIQFPEEILMFATGANKSRADLGEQARTLGAACAAILLPSAYLFFSGILIFAFNCILASFRFYGHYDLAVNRLDSWLMAGATVSSLARWSFAHLPIAVFRWANVVYFSMFAQVGACIILLGLKCGLSRSMQYMKSVVTAYYLALLVYAILPALGPFLITPNDFPEALHSTPIYVYQKATLAILDQLWAHRPIAAIGMVYFIGLPALHIAQPVIMWWYMRRWRRIAIAMAIYDVLLIPSILLLEQHYVTDLIAGFFVGLLAILMIPEPKLASASVHAEIPALRQHETPVPLPMHFSSR